MNQPSPIPIPLRQKWHDFKTEYFPILTFFILCGVIIWMWGRYVSPTNIVGEVESIHSPVISTVSGTLMDIKVDRFQRVTNGQVLAVLNVMDAVEMSNEVAVIQADLRLLKARMDIDKTRNVSTWSQMRHDVFEERLALEIAKVRMVQAESELARAQNLFQEKLIPAGVSDNAVGYEVALRDRDGLRAEIERRTQIIEENEKDIQKIQSTGVVTIDPVDEAIEKDIEAQIRRLQLANQCVELRAPMDGVVTVINHRSGEKLMAGTPVVVVGSDHAERVLAWARQPVTRIPQLGESVSIHQAHVGAGHAITGKVVKVGSQYETISPTVMPLNSSQTKVELGLPFLVELPAKAPLIPGEPVQVRFKRSSGLLN